LETQIASDCGCSTALIGNRAKRPGQVAWNYGARRKDCQAKDVSGSNDVLTIDIIMSYHKSAQISSMALEPA